MKIKIVSILILAVLLVFPSMIRAWEPGGCLENHKSICYGPVISIASLIDPKTIGFETGMDLGPGYGIRFLSDHFYSVGADFFLFAHTGGTDQNKLRMAITGSFLRSIRIGYAFELSEGKSRSLIVLGLGMDFKAP